MKPLVSKLAIIAILSVPNLASSAEQCNAIELWMGRRSAHVIARDRGLILSALNIKPSGKVLKGRNVFNSIGYHSTQGYTTWVGWLGPRYESNFKIRESFEEVIQKHISREVRKFAKAELARPHSFSFDLRRGLTPTGYVEESSWIARYGNGAYARYDLTATEVKQLLSSLASDSSYNLVFPPRQDIRGSAYLVVTSGGNSNTRVIDLPSVGPDKYNPLVKQNLTAKLLATLAAHPERMKVIKARFIVDITYYIPGLYRDALAPRVQRQK